MFTNILENLTKNLSTFTVEIKENKDNFLLLAHLPGLKKEELDIYFNKGFLFIEKNTQTASTEKTETDSNEYVTIYSEIFDFHIKRKFAFGDRVQQDNIKANFIDGVLHVTLPKIEDKASKKINID